MRVEWRWIAPLAVALPACFAAVKIPLGSELRRVSGPTNNRKAPQFGEEISWEPVEGGCDIRSLWLQLVHLRPPAVSHDRPLHRIKPFDDPIRQLSRQAVFIWTE
ncbi:hypothetical protein P152DRAFT_251954 [Eremomyces bilateralis CBS 781.70]|uniref:Uncharacterized protein n=1 Tax=Eremomyces bilateralis CBS 781.70 TaxID=1392243 RepID=A0A6G1FQY7_9PEZI|nr:uncharacterized protein P152DRAFT_251954 [Eremomyces bilateralis CBS 781.70]KAF1808197.1 hypothetical protein P152DRAFT_251954 [Eremomyces bilateralis CBS 781.70]